MNNSLNPSAPITTPAIAVRYSRMTILIMACALFILSGACGLAYEVVWTKFLGRFLGNTVLLHAAVLGTFMGGLALGSLIVSRLLPRIKEPLKAYGWLEVCVAGYALIFPTLADMASGVVPSAAATLGVGTLPLLLVRIGLGVVLLLPPTLLMGATLPLLTAAVERLTAGEDRREQGENGANWLYFANCAGAVLGTLITGFVLIPSLGLTATVQGVGIINAFVGLGAVGAGTRFLTIESEPTPSKTIDRVPPSKTQHGSAAPVYFAICLSGATAFLYELVWTRLFAINLGSSTYSFTLMLAAFISGLCLGGICANLLPTRRAPLLWFAGAEIAIGAAITLSVFYLPRLPLDLLNWHWTLRPVEETIFLYRLGVYAILFVIMLLPTFLFGLTFPTAIRSAIRLSNTERPDEVAEQTASVYGWNTLGTLLGVTVTGAVLIPIFGLQRSLQIGAVTNLLIGGAVLMFSQRAPDAKATRPHPAYAIVGAATLAAILLTPRWSVSLMNYGTFRYDHPPVKDFAELKLMAATRELVFSQEDFGTSVVVIHNKSTSYGGAQNALIVDGKVDATSLGDMPTQALLGHLPLLLKPDAKNVYVLGLGSGVTVASALRHPIEHMDCLEISRAVVNSASYFSDVTHAALKDSRLNLVTDDGKTFLASTQTRYDVLINEPTNLWISGTSDLFSEEMFRSCAHVLKPGGIVVQWFHATGMSDELVATVVRTFHRVFPHIVIFEACGSDYLMVGSMEPLKPDYAAMEKRMAEPLVKADLEEIGIDSVAAVLARQSHSESVLPQLEANGGINSDDLPILEYETPNTLYTGKLAKRIGLLDQRHHPDGTLFIESYLRDRTFLPVSVQQEDYRSIMRTLSEIRSGNNALAHALVESYLSRFPNDAEFWRMSAELYGREGNWDRAADDAAQAVKYGDKRAVNLLTICKAQLKAPAFAPPGDTTNRIP